MIAEISGVISSVRALSDLVKAGNSVRNATEIANAIADIQSKLMSAQSAVLVAQDKQSALSERIREMEKEIGVLKDWNREAERYQLTEIGSGRFAYSVKLGMEFGEPAHYLCANCFTQRQKSILQFSDGGYDDRLTCPRCKNEFYPSSSKIRQSPR